MRVPECIRGVPRAPGGCHGSSHHAKQGGGYTKRPTAEECTGASLVLRPI